MCRFKKVNSRHFTVVWSMTDVSQIYIADITYWLIYLLTSLFFYFLALICTAEVGIRYLVTAVLGINSCHEPVTPPFNNFHHAHYLQPLIFFPYFSFIVHRFQFSLFLQTNIHNRIHYQISGYLRRWCKREHVTKTTRHADLGAWPVMWSFSVELMLEGNHASLPAHQLVLSLLYKTDAGGPFTSHLHL